MSQTKDNFSKIGAYAVFGLLSALLLYTVIQGWTDKLDARWISSASFVLIAGLVALLWKKLRPWSLVHLLGTAFIVLIGGIALYYSPEAKAAFKLGPLNLSLLVNLLIFLSLSLSLFFLLRGLKLSRNIKIGIGVFGALCSVPYLIALFKDIPLPALLKGAGFVSFIPWFLQPAFLGIVLLLPILLLFLLLDFFKTLKSDKRSPLRSGFNIMMALVPLSVGLASIIGQSQAGIVARYFSAHNYGKFETQKIEAAPVLEWKQPPVKPELEQQFWVEWEGLINIPKDGEYEFRIKGEGQGFLYLDGRRVFGDKRKSGKMTLKAGRHTFRAAAIENKADGSFRLQWSAPGDEDYSDIPPNQLGFSSEQKKWRRTPRQAAQVGIDWLQSASYDWQKQRRCFGCHVQGQVLMGLSVAEKNDYDVNRDYFDALFDYTKTKQNKNGTYHSGHYVTSTQFAAMGMAHAQRIHSSKKNDNFIKSVDWLLGRQGEDGIFKIDHNEAPIDQGSIMSSANTVVALMQAYKEKGDKKYKQAAERALAWIATADAQTTQDKTFKILSLSEYGSASQARIAEDVVKQLKSEQQPDGAWKETGKMNGSNAYATGQVLYAFKKAGVSVNSSEFSKGVRFLLDQQKISGAWPAKNTQTHRPSEFAPTMWAVIGLAGSFGEIIPEIIKPKDKSAVDGKVMINSLVTNFTDSKINSVKFTLDGAPLGDGVKAEQDKLFTYAWDATGLKEGEHLLKVIATNAAGKSGESTVTVYSGLGVQVKIVNPKTAATITTTQNIVAEAKGLYGQKIEKVTFFVTPAGKTQEQSKIGEVTETAEADIYSIDWDASQLPEGVYQITALAINTRGQEAQDSIQVTKRSPLAVKIKTPTSGATLTGMANCTASVTNNTEDPTDYVEFFLDNEFSLGRSVDTKMETPCDFTEASLGAHTLKVIAHTKGGLTAEHSIPLKVGEEKGPGYLKVQLKNLDQPGGEQVLYFPPDNIELVVDMSNSMWGQIDGVAKVTIARDVLGKLLGSFPKDASLGLRIYGHRSKGDCEDSELLIPFGQFDPAAIQSKVNALKPKGMTPIDYSLRESLKDIQALKGSRVIILLTDGIESCKGDPVKAAKALMAAGLKVKIHVVGFDIGNEPEAIKQLEQVSAVGEGKFFLAKNAESLTDALAEAVKVTYSVYDEAGELVFANPLSLESNELMSGTYRIEVALDPPLVLDKVKIEKGKTSTIDIIKENKAFRIMAAQPE